jgi:hypothetical protein
MSRGLAGHRAARNQQVPCRPLTNRAPRCRVSLSPSLVRSTGGHRKSNCDSQAVRSSRRLHGVRSSQEGSLPRKRSGMNTMIKVQEFCEELQTLLPDTYCLLRRANLTMHPSVSRITLHGSRGLARTCRPGSDIDLSLLVQIAPLAMRAELAALLHDVLSATLRNWQGSVKPDLAAVFDIRNCGLRCFELTRYQPYFCSLGRINCCGIYKMQGNTEGFVSGFEVDVAKMYPCLTIWKNPSGDEPPASRGRGIAA